MANITVKQSGDFIYIRQPYTSTHDIIRRVEVPAQAAGENGQTDFRGTVTCLASATSDPDTLYASPESTLNNSDDNAPPVKINGAFVAANHTIRSFIITKASHGLTDTAVGDVGADSAAKNWVIIEIVDTDNIRVAPQNTGTATDWVINGVITGDTITFTTSGAYVFTASTSTPALFPFNQDFTREYWMDGSVIADLSTAVDGDNFEVRESYGIPNAGAILSTLISDHPTATPKSINDSSIQTQIQVSTSWRFDSFGGRTSTYAIYNEQDYLFNASDYIGGFQQNSSNPPSGGKKLLYIPDVGITDGYNFKDKDDITNNSSTVEVNVADCDDATNPASHFATVLTTSSDVPVFGHVLGYRRNYGVGIPSVRAALCDLIFNVSPAEKLYPAALSSGSQPSGGENYAVQTYDCFYDMSSDPYITVNACVEFSDGRVHWIFDCHRSISSEWIALPSSLVGKSVRIVNSSDSFTLNGAREVTSNGLNISVSGGYGHAVIEIYNMSDIQTWKGAVEPAETAPSGNEIQAWKGALEPAAVTANQSSLGITLSANGDLGLKKEIGGVQGFRDSMSSTYQAPKADFVRYPKRKR